MSRTPNYCRYVPSHREPFDVFLSKGKKETFVGGNYLVQNCLQPSAEHLPNRGESETYGVWKSTDCVFLSLLFFSVYLGSPGIPLRIPVFTETHLEIQPILLYMALLL